MSTIASTNTNSIYRSSTITSSLISPVSYNPIIKKTTSVAVGVFLFLSVQFGFPIFFSGVCALSCAGTTVLSEKFIRQNFKDKDWFNFKIFDLKQIKYIGIQIFTQHTIAGILLKILKVSPVQHICKLIQAGKVYPIFIAGILAPIVEEIVFRGFLQESLEDSMYLVGRYIYPIKKETRQSISQIAQVIIFGALHMNHLQSPVSNVVIFAATSVLGWVFTIEKRKRAGSLINSICIHGINNISFIVRIFVFAH